MKDHAHAHHHHHQLFSHLFSPERGCERSVSPSPRYMNATSMDIGSGAIFVRTGCCFIWCTTKVYCCMHQQPNRSKYVLEKAGRHTLHMYVTHPAVRGNRNGTNNRRYRRRRARRSGRGGGGGGKGRPSAGNEADAQHPRAVAAAHEQSGMYVEYIATSYNPCTFCVFVLMFILPSVLC